MHDNSTNEAVESYMNQVITPPKEVSTRNNRNNRTSESQRLEYSNAKSHIYMNSPSPQRAVAMNQRPSIDTSENGSNYGNAAGAVVGDVKPMAGSRNAFNPLLLSEDDFRAKGVVPREQPSVIRESVPTQIEESITKKSRPGSQAQDG